METKVNGIAVFGSGCFGCIRKNSYIMVSFLHPETNEFHDILLTKEQSLKLSDELQYIIKENETKNTTN